MPHVMVDIETMDTEVTTVICSIGACFFNPEIMEIGSTFYQKLDWSKQTPGRTIGSDTVKWWLHQEKAAQAELVKSDSGSLYGTLSQFMSWLGYPEYVWANGINFDIAILTHAAKQFNIHVPWKYNAPQELRTLRLLNLVGDNEVPVNPMEHNALEDAKWQAHYAMAALAKIKQGSI